MKRETRGLEIIFYLSCVTVGSLFFNTRSFLVFLMVLETSLLLILSQSMMSGLGVGVFCMFLTFAAFESGVGLSLLLRNAPQKGAVLSSNF